METVILVSVLATLGVVAIVGAIVVAFKKLNTKVDVHDQERIYQSLDDVAHTINRRLDDMDQNFGNEVNDVYRTIDSRCDKLYDLYVIVVLVCMFQIVALLNQLLSRC